MIADRRLAHPTAAARRSTSSASAWSARRGTRRLLECADRRRTATRRGRCCRPPAPAIACRRCPRRRRVACRLSAAAFNKIALARVAWALHLMLNVEMDIRRDSRHWPGDGVGQQPVHTSRAAPSRSAVDRGAASRSAVAYALTGVFPREFLDGARGRRRERADRRDDATVSHAAYEGRAEHGDRRRSHASPAFLIWAAVATLIVSAGVPRVRLLHRRALRRARGHRRTAGHD